MVIENRTGIICEVCHFENSVAASFCSNCGKQLKGKPLSSGISKQAVIYFISFFLPPLGLWYVWKYLRQPDRKLKNIGIVALVLTIISTILAIWLSTATINELMQSMSALNGV